ncbi:thioredoxin-like protein [Gymnopilus junonius]|uniref:glutathione transferase n=1 Tax=Gymnopilus junonius TaxID=109634 RepID=A0A9P5TS02_GYMJU|nr:thioredoxin-like protein [Gymnopilus junonius]
MLILPHLNNSRSQRILWLLEELGIPYEIKKYERTTQQLAPPELLEISALGKAPIITDGDVTLAESGAIIEYLITRYGNGKGVPTESGYLDNLYFSHYAEGSLMPILVQKVIFDIVPKNSPFLIRPLVKSIFEKLDSQLVQNELKKHFSMIEAHLAKSPSGWFAGGQEPTAANYQMSFPLEAVVADAPEMAGPQIKKFVQIVHNREAFKKALERGGEYSYARL